LLADQQESRAFVNNSRDLSGMQKSQLNLLTILFQPDAFSRLSECCGAAKMAIADIFYIATFSKRYKLYNAANESGQQAAQGAWPGVFSDSALPETG
jgi:hypothetical protein